MYTIITAPNKFLLLSHRSPTKWVYKIIHRYIKKYKYVFMSNIFILYIQIMRLPCEIVLIFGIKMQF